MTKYKDAYTEVYEILEQLDEEEYNKIPSNVITAIRENRNTEYEFELDDESELKEQELLPETKAILFNIFRDYLSTPEQKEKIIKMQAEERLKNEQKKANQYNSDLFANKQKVQSGEIEHTELIEYKENIFKSLSLENVDYKKSYEEGALKGNHLSFIVLNLFDDEEAFYYFCNTNNEFNNISYQIEKLIENMAYKRFYLASNDKLESVIENIIYENQIEVKGYNVNPIIQLVEHCNQYNRLVYSVDLLNNLDNNFQELFYTEEFEILPPDIWKNMHISLEDLNEFLMSDDLFYFCKQTIGKIESKQRHNFLNSNSVKFLRNAIEYDKQWIDTFDESEGLYIEKINDKYTTYPVKVAIFLRTYDELTNKRKVKILSGNKKSQLLKSLLTNNNDPFPQSLPMQIFNLVCHFQYDNITKEIPFGFYNYTTLLSERLFCTIMIKTTETYNFDMNIKYLNTLYDDLCDLVEVLK